MYKLLNNDRVAKELLGSDPFNGETPKYLKVDLEHYMFTDFKKERVTFGLKLLFDKLLPPLSRMVLPKDLQRYFSNERVVEKFAPTHWWRRSDSPKYRAGGDTEILGSQNQPILKREKYLDVISKESLEPFIKQNKLAYYN